MVFLGLENKYFKMPSNVSKVDLCTSEMAQGSQLVLVRIVYNLFCLLPGLSLSNNSCSLHKLVTVYP